MRRRCTRRPRAGDLRGWGVVSGPPRAGASGGQDQEKCSGSPPSAVPRPWGRDRFPVRWRPRRCGAWGPEPSFHPSAWPGRVEIGAPQKGWRSPFACRMLPVFASSTFSPPSLPLVAQEGVRAADVRAAVSPPHHFSLKRIYPIVG